MKAEAADARKGVVRVALDPIVQACDAIDNSHSKSETVKAIRQDIERAYQALHALLNQPADADDGAVHQAEPSPREGQ